MAQTAGTPNAHHCAVCHANNGSGETEMGQGDVAEGAGHAAAGDEDLSDGELFWIIENGIRFTGMLGWSTGTPEGETASWDLVHFIRHLPEIGETKLEEIDALIPRSVADIRQETRGRTVPSGRRRSAAALTSER